MARVDLAVLLADRGDRARVEQLYQGAISAGLTQAEIDLANARAGAPGPRLPRSTYLAAGGGRADHPARDANQMPDHNDRLDVDLEGLPSEPVASTQQMPMMTCR